MLQKPELDLSNEISDLLFTEEDATHISSPFIYRKVRRDPVTDAAIVCPACNSNYNGSKEGQQSCPYCLGIGYLFDESIQKGYMYNKHGYSYERNNLNSPQPAGRNSNTSVTLVTKSDLLLRESDYVMVPELLPDGNIRIPLRYVFKYYVFFAKSLYASGTNADFNIAILAN